MHGRDDHSECTHQGFHSGLGRYLHESQQIRYVLVCDDCGTDVREVSIENYAPNPLFEAVQGI
jgi:hypothetical protein